MRTNNTTLAALAAVGGLLLTRQLRKRRQQTATYYVDNALNRDVQVRMPMTTVLAGLAGLVGGGLALSSYMRSSAGENGMSSVEESIELDVPVSTAYNQWTQFEDFPKFMATVQQVNQVDDTHLHWRAIVAGKVKEWDAEITEQTPDKRIAWRSTSGPQNAGVVTFHKVGENRTRVMLQMDYTPETVGEKVADAVGGVKLTAKGNLKKFKQLVESRGVETGAWRGTVPQH
jgi:uncharacterized membrane protein